MEVGQGVFFYVPLCVQFMKISENALQLMCISISLIVLYALLVCGLGYFQLPVPAAILCGGTEVIASEGERISGVFLCV